MDTKTTLKRIKKSKEKKEFLKQFNKYKDYILKKYPNSSLKIFEGRFYVADATGARILRDEYNFPDSDSAYGAWKNTYDMLWSKHIVDRNNRKFSDERIITGDFPGRKKSKIILK